MKVFGIIALVGATLGLAAAGPVQKGGPQSMCNIQCHGGIHSKLNFIPGRTYSFKYTTKTETALEQTNQEKSVIYMDADVDIHAIDSCRLALKVNSARLDEEITGRGRQPSKGTQQLSENLMKEPLMFNYEDGVVSRLCPAAGESDAALNIKRGILSLIQNSMGKLNGEGMIHEVDVTGECKTQYTIAKGWTGGMTVLKTKSLSGCRNEDSQSFNMAHLPRQIAHSSSVVNATQECTQNIKNGVVDSVHCRERHVVRPFSRQDKGAATTVAQELKLQGAVDGKAQAENFHYEERSPATLLFDRRADMETMEANLEQHVISALELLTHYQKESVQHAPVAFSELVGLLRKMEYGSLKKIVTSRKDAALIDALMNTMTHDAIRVTSELVKEGHIQDSSAKLWLMKTALTTDVNPKIVAHIMGLFDKQPLMMEAYLAASSVARTAFVEGRGRTPEIRELLRVLTTQLQKSGNDNEMIITLRAIGNLGEVAGPTMKGALMKMAQDSSLSTATRMSVVEATRRFRCSDVDTETMLQLFLSTSNEAELRVAAYLRAVKCPNYDLVMTVKEVLRREPRTSEVGAFVFTHMKNLEKLSWFHQDVTPITEDDSLKYFEKSPVDFTKSRVYEMFFDPLDMGFEVEADTLMSGNFKTFMLNATFDIFGHNTNLFDTRVRMQNDMASFDGFVRFFGKEIMYKGTNGRNVEEMKSMLQSIISPEGLHFTRSMMILDTEMILPTGTGLPLAITVNATSTLSMDVKANAPTKQEGGMTSAVRAAPAAALEIGISMTVKALQTVSGIRLMALASSQWALDADIQTGSTAASGLKINVGAPRDRSDILDIKSNVYLIGANEQREIASSDAGKQEWTYCTGKQTHVLFGHQICLDAAYPVAHRDSAPAFLLRGKNHLNIRLSKTDKSLSKFQFEAYAPRLDKTEDELLFKLDTPGSQVDRKMMLRVYNDIPNEKFGVEFISPIKKAAIVGTYKGTPNAKKMHALFKVDDETKMVVKGDMGIATGRTNIYTPVLEIVMGSRQVLMMKSEVAFQGMHKINGDLELTTAYNPGKPIRLNGEYAISGKNSRRMSLGLESENLDAAIASTLSLEENNWAANVEGHYSHNKGAKQTFVLGTKLIDAEDNMLASADLHHNGVAVLAASGRYVRGNPRSADVSVVLHGKQYGVRVSHDVQPNENILIAAAEIDSKRYTSTLRYALNDARSKLDLKVQLPDGIEKNAKISFARTRGTIKASAMTDVWGKPYSAVVSYAPGDIHKVLGNLKMGEERFQATGMLSLKGNRQGKLELLHNNAKVLMAMVTVGEDLTRPKLKSSVIYREKLILDVSTEAVFELHGASVLFAMRAPRKLNGNIAVKQSGSINDNLKVEISADVRDQEKSLNLALTSSADLALYGRSKRANLDGSMTLSGGRIIFALKNMIDGNSWNVDWMLGAPQYGTDAKLTTSGSHSLNTVGDMHFRGNFEVDAKSRLGQLRIKPVSINGELRHSPESVEFKTEVTHNAKTLIATGLKGVHTHERTEASAEMTLMDNVYSTEFSLFGRNLRESGVKMAILGRYNENKIKFNGHVQLAPENAFVSVDVETPFKELPTARAFLSQQLAATGIRVLRADLGYEEEYVRADVSVSGHSLDADIQTSLRNWENMKALAEWQSQPRMRLTLKVTHAKYGDNTAEIELKNTDNGYAVNGRLSVPRLFEGELAKIDGTLEGERDLMSGKAHINVVYRGQPTMKAFVELRNEARTKKIIATATHTLNGAQQLLKAEMEMKTTDNFSYEAKVSAMRDAEKIFEAQYVAALRTTDGLFGELQIDAKTSLLNNWNSLWLMNKLIIGANHFDLRHEFGQSRNDLVSSFEAFGSLKDNAGQLMADGTVRAQLNELKGSASAELKSIRMKKLEMNVKVDSPRGHLVDAKLNLDAQSPMINIEGSFELPQLREEATLKMNVGLRPQNEAFEFDAKLERNASPAKTTQVSIRIPLTLRSIDGHFKVELPEELGRHAVRAHLTMQKKMIETNFEAAINDRTFSAEGTCNWNRGLNLNAGAKLNKNFLAKFELNAERRSEHSAGVSGKFQFRDLIYTAKLEGEVSPKRVSLNAETTNNNGGNQRHFVNAEFSEESKAAKLRVDVAQLGLNLDSTWEGNYQLKANLDYKMKQMGYFDAEFVPADARGTLKLSADDKMVSANIVAKPNGELKIEMPGSNGELSWNVKQTKADAEGRWTLDSGKTYAQTLSLSWAGDNYDLGAELTTPAGKNMMTFKLVPSDDGKAELTYMADGRRMFSVGTGWTMNGPKMQVSGHWIFENQDWLVELTLNPKKVGDLKATILYHQQRVGNAELQWNIEQGFTVKSNFELHHQGQKHLANWSFDWQSGSFAGDVKVHCPWLQVLQGTPFETKVNFRYSPENFSFFGQFTMLNETHSMKLNGKIAGEHITGSVEVNCPTHGFMKGTVEGFLKDDEVYVKIGSDKLNKPIEFSGKITPRVGQIDYTLSSERIQATGALFYGNSQYGFTFHMAGENQCNIVASVRPFEAIIINVQSPVLGKTGFSLQKRGNGQFGGEGFYGGRKFMVANCTFGEESWLVGQVEMNVDFEAPIGTHDIKVDYDLVHKNTVMVTLDGITIVDVTLSRDKLAVKLTLRTQHTGDIQVFFKHGDRNALVAQAFTVQQNDKKFGYDIYLSEKQIRAAVELPERSGRMNFVSERRENGNDITGELAWDNTRDANKKVHIKIVHSSERDGRLNMEVSAEVPSIQRKIDYRINLQKIDSTTWRMDTEAKYNGEPMFSAEGKIVTSSQGYQAVFDGKHPISGKPISGSVLLRKSSDTNHHAKMMLKSEDSRWTVQYSNNDDILKVLFDRDGQEQEYVSYEKYQGRFTMGLGGLHAVAQATPKESKLMAVHGSVEYLALGYEVNERTISGFARWNPQMVTDLKMATKDVQRKLERGEYSERMLREMDMSEHVKSEWRFMSNFIATEMRAFTNDVAAMGNRLIEFYEREPVVKSTLEPVVRAATESSRWAGQMLDDVRNTMSDVYKRSKRSIGRYAERLNVVKVVAAALYNEVYEDVSEKAEQLLDRVIPEDSAVRRVARRSIDWAKETLGNYNGAIQRLAEDNICELATDETHLRNKRCGMAYQFRPELGNFGLAMRVPTVF